MTISNQQFESAYFRRLRNEWNEEGHVGAMVESLKTVLNARGFELSDEQKACLRACSVPDRLREWVRRAATSASIEDVLR